MMIFYDRKQQHRLIFTFDPEREQFSVGCWSSWVRVPEATGSKGFNPNAADANIKRAPAVIISNMEALWPTSSMLKNNSKDKLKNATKARAGKGE